MRLLLCSLFFCSLLHAQEKDPHARRFNGWDQNQDGRLVLEELPEGLRRNFNRVDTDHDGFISRAEDRAYMERGKNQNKRRRAKDTLQIQADIPYAGTDNPRQMLDLALPKTRASSRPLPVLVFIHGGGWKNGSKDGGLRRLSKLLEGGHYAGVSIGYRLSGEARWPAQIHDCKAAIRWIRGNAKRLGLDPDRIGIWGSSAGGQLVSMLGVSGGVNALEGTLGPHTAENSRVSCVVNYYGPSELLTMNDFPSRIDHNAPDSPESQLIGGAIQEHKPQARAASPIRYATKDDAPILHVHGTADELVPYNQSEMLHAALKKEGAASWLQTITGGGHGGFDGPALAERVRVFFDRHLRGSKAELRTDPLKPKQ